MRDDGYWVLGMLICVYEVWEWECASVTPEPYVANSCSCPIGHGRGGNSRGRK